MGWWFQVKRVARAITEKLHRTNDEEERNRGHLRPFGVGMVVGEWCRA
jgi:hypothetical protein